MEIISKLLNKKPENKAALYLIYYPLMGVAMVIAWLLVSYVLPEIVAVTWAVLFPLWLLAMLVLGVLSLVGFLVKKWLLS